MRDDEQLRHFLLGDLPESEMEGLEQRLLREDELFELAEAIESELLEEYAHGDLSPRERGRVARRLAARPASQLRLAVIRGLARVAPEGRVLPFGRREPVRPDLRPEFRVAAIAAMLAILVAGGWLASQRAHPPEPVVRAATPSQTPPPPAVEPPPAPPAADAGQRIAQAPPPSAPTPAPPAPSLTTAVLQIAVTAVRGPEETQERTVPAGTGRVELQFVLASGDEGYPSYRVTLADAAGAEVAARKSLRPKRIGSDHVLVLTLDAQRLPEGRYTAEVQGITADEEAESLAFPEFQIHTGGVK